MHYICVSIWICAKWSTKEPVLDLKLQRPAVVVHTFGRSTQKAEAGGDLQTEFQDS